MRSATTHHSKQAISTNGDAKHSERLQRTNALQDVDVQPARAGDHVLIYQLLQHIFHAPSMAEFQASQDAPLYEPSDRLVARLNGRLFGHVHVVNRTMNFDSVRVPVADVRHLGVLPELRGRGLGSELLQAAEEKIVEEGGQIALLRTSEPQFFARRGWVVCGRHSSTTATTRDVLAELADIPPVEKSPLAKEKHPPVVRLWRQVEQDNIARLYNSSSQFLRGSFVRSHEYWRWLVSRHAFERFYVAVDENDPQHSDGIGSANIVGYAVASGARILELQVHPEYPSAGRQLLTRACSDAIERGENTLRFDAPADDPLHELLQQAGGRFSQNEYEQGEVLMAKLFDPWKFLDQLRGDIYTRAKTSGLTLPLEFGLCVDGEKRQLVITRRSAKLLSGKTGRSYLTCNHTMFCRLLLGELKIKEAEQSGLIAASTRVAVETARTLFPAQPLWFSPLDHEPAE